jgi:hypothetical protein
MEYSSTEQTIAWFRNQYRDGALVIKPPYQRKPVWAARQKSYLIESVLLNLPVPEIYLQQTTDADGHTVHAVVDGQQRIRTILQFVGAELDPEEAEHNEFVLETLPRDSDYYGVGFGDLSEEMRKAFFGYRLSVRLLETDDEEDVRKMFTRLNKFLTPLNAQELRNSTFTGPFARLAESLSDDDYWTESKLVTTASIRRMKDIEFVSELLIGVLHGPQGGSARVVDGYYSRYEDYEDEFPGQRPARRRFKASLATIQHVLPELKTSRWGNRTDFYTLFVAIAALQREMHLPARERKNLREHLLEFGDAVDERLADEDADVEPEVIDYVRAVEKGANDKARRGDRHAIMRDILSEYFVEAT